MCLAARTYYAWDEVSVSARRVFNSHTRFQSLLSHSDVCVSGHDIVISNCRTQTTKCATPHTYAEFTAKYGTELLEVKSKEMAEGDDAASLHAFNEGLGGTACKTD